MLSKHIAVQRHSRAVATLKQSICDECSLSAGPGAVPGDCRTGRCGRAWGRGRRQSWKVADRVGLKMSWHEKKAVIGLSGDSMNYLAEICASTDFPPTGANPGGSTIFQLSNRNSMRLFGLEQ